MTNRIQKQATSAYNYLWQRRHRCSLSLLVKKSVNNQKSRAQRKIPNGKSFIKWKNQKHQTNGESLSYPEWYRHFLMYKVVSG